MSTQFFSALDDAPVLAEVSPDKCREQAGPDLSPATPASAAGEHSLLGVTELLLKHPARVDALARVPARQGELIPRFLAIGLGSFSIFALALVMLFEAAPVPALPPVLAPRWTAHPTASAVGLWLAYALGFTLATGVCLPSFYFYGLLSGVKISVLQVTAQVMKGKAATSILLMGVLPIYVAVVLGAIVFRLPEARVQLALELGLVLPFLAGVWGARSISQGFMALADTLPPARRCRRECFLRRLTVACSACYAAVAPVMIYALWNWFIGILAG
jgi:hypothetical protein